MTRSRKLFKKEVGKVSGGNLESCSRIREGNERMAVGEHEARRSWKIIFRISII